MVLKSVRVFCVMRGLRLSMQAPVYYPKGSHMLTMQGALRSLDMARESWSETRRSEGTRGAANTDFLMDPTADAAAPIL
eukprot:569471-Alexandrium_andersonii.AAC.1